MLSLLRQYLQHEVLFNEGKLIATFKNNFGSKLVKGCLRGKTRIHLPFNS